MNIGPRIYEHKPPCLPGSGLPHRHASQGRVTPTLLCLPYAGGRADCFNALRARLDGEAHVFTVCYPGRGLRSSEEAHCNIDAMAEEIDQALDDIDGPVVLFGYSMGAIVAYEVAVKREERGKTPPSHVLLLACRAPTDFRVNSLLTDDDEEFVRIIARHGAIPEALTNRSGILQRYLPALRSDLNACERYRPSSARLPCAITVIGSDNDLLAPLSDLERWSSYTVHGADFFVFKGDHFFLRNNMDEVSAIVRSRISEAVARSAPSTIDRLVFPGQLAG